MHAIEHDYCLWSVISCTLILCYLDIHNVGDEEAFFPRPQAAHNDKEIGALFVDSEPLVQGYDLISRLCFARGNSFDGSPGSKHLLLRKCGLEFYHRVRFGYGLAIGTEQRQPKIV